jgi:transaldolase
MKNVKELISKLIVEEREREQKRNADDVVRLIKEGQIARASGNLLFHTQPGALRQKLANVLEKINRTDHNAEIELQVHILNFLVKLGLDLRSFVPNWHIRSRLNTETVDDMAEEVVDMLLEKEKAWSGAAATVVKDLHGQTVARLKAEGVANPAESAAALTGDSLSDYVLNISRELQKSNLYKAGLARLRGETQTELGNDYAAFLQYAIWLGASFVTTNPVLIKLAWDVAPELWNQQVDNIILSRYKPEMLAGAMKNSGGELEKVIEVISSMVTMAVVEKNCRLLRDIFLFTEGRNGYVSLQVNPRNHDDVQQMMTEAGNLYSELKNRLGGIPNVVFKLPATEAGKRAAEMLTKDGIGVTITVEFSVFQVLEFAEILSRGNALVCYLALMNGRMALPVQEEMKKNAIQGGVDAARWAGVEVARKAHRLMYGSEKGKKAGIDASRVKLLIASLRVYGDWIPDISELWGIPVITFFPDVRRKFDNQVRDFKGNAVCDKTPAEDLKLLFASEIFRQAWWVPGDSEEYKPEKVLSLQPRDSQALRAWTPVFNTLNQFIDLYGKMGEMIKGRISYLVDKEQS